MNKRAGIVVLLLSFVGAGEVVFASDPGTTGASILSWGVGARAIGMGEAYTAMADDISSLYWNPAGIALLNQSQASFMYNQALKDLTFNNAAVAFSLENGGIGANISYLSYGKIEGFDNNGDPTGNINAYSGVATVGGGWLLGDFSLGANVKGIQGELADVKANGFAFDLGSSYVFPQPVFGESTLRFAATVRNLGPGMKYLTQTDPYPTEWRVGTSLLQLLDQKLNVAMDYGKVRSEEGSIYAGLEYCPSPYIALRTGYAGNHTEGMGLRAGIGLKIKDISFDYAYASFGDLGLTHRYELTYRFGEIRPRLTPEERKLYRQAKAAIRDERYGEATLIMDSLVRMEPKYKPFARTYKTALKGNDVQEKMAQGQNTFSVLNATGGRPAATLSDLDDLEALLKTSDEAANQSAKAPQRPGATR
jgi:hypothetical protein